MQTTRTLEGFQVTEYPVEKLGYSISVIYINFGEAGVGYKKSNEILNKLGLEPVPSQKFFMAMLNNPELLDTIKTDWSPFGYLAGEGSDKDGIFAINEKTGELEAPKGDESAEKLVRTWAGKWPLRACVCSDNVAASHGSRFILDATIPSATWVVFGIKPNGAARVPKERRMKKGETLEVTLRDGQKIHIDDAAAVKIVKRAKRE